MQAIKSELVLEGTTYRLLTERIDGMYYVSWLCTKCWEGAGATVRKKTREEAAKRAEVEIRAHHERSHVP
jgi:hypothetical protein